MKKSDILLQIVNHPARIVCYLVGLKMSNGKQQMRLEIENEWKRKATHTRDFQNEPSTAN